MFINALAGCIYIPSNVLKAIVLFAIVIIFYVQNREDNLCN